jgi:hypothetical protein
MVNMIFILLMALQETPAADPPLLDFDRLELNPRAGFAVFSDDFESDPRLCAGLLARAPLARLSRALLGPGEENTLGASAQITLASVERDLDPEPRQPEGTILFAGLGLDATIFDRDGWLLRPRLEVQYGYYGDVSGLEDGWALAPGLQAAAHLTGNLWFSLDAQAALADAGDRILFGQAGLLIRF